MSKKIIIIYGPTTAGKTSLAIKLAKKLNTEVISADSRQIFSELDILSGKYSKSDKIEKHSRYWIVNGVRINLYDNKNLTDLYSVSEFLRDANQELNRIFISKDIAVIAGGTGLYISSLIKPIETIDIKPDQKLRDKLSKLTTPQLQKKLQKTNIQKYQSLNESDINNPRRLIRALEISATPPKKNSKNPRVSDYYFIYLKPERELLRLRIKSWYEEKLEMGLIKEVKNIRKKHSSQNLTYIGIIYVLVSRYLDGEIKKQDLDFHLPVAIYRFAKRQLLWFRNDPKINYYEIKKSNQQDTETSIITAALRWYNKPK